MRGPKTADASAGRDVLQKSAGGACGGGNSNRRESFGSKPPSRGLPGNKPEPNAKARRTIGTRREPWEGGRPFGVVVDGRHPGPGKPGSLHGGVRWKRSWLSPREGSYGVRNEGGGDGVSEARPVSVWRQGGECPRPHGPVRRSGLPDRERQVVHRGVGGPSGPRAQPVAARDVGTRL